MSVAGISHPLGILQFPSAIERHIRSFLRSDALVPKDASDTEKAYAVAMNALENATALHGIAFSSKAPSTHRIMYKKHIEAALKAIRSQKDAEKFLQKAILESNPQLALLVIEEAEKTRSFIGFSSALIFLAEKDFSEGRLAIAKLLISKGANARYVPSEGARSAQTIAAENNNNKLLSLFN